MRSFKELPPHPSNGPAGNVETNLKQNLLDQAASPFAWLRLREHVSQVLQGGDVVDRANLEGCTLSHIVADDTAALLLQSALWVADVVDD